MSTQKPSQIIAVGLAWLGLFTLLLALLSTGEANARGLKHCGATPPFGATSARGVSCYQAHRVVKRWGKTRGCGPDGSTCNVLDWRCSVPVTPSQNGTRLECRQRQRLIIADLGYY